MSDAKPSDVPAPDLARWTRLTENEDWNARARRVAELIPPTATVLDVGCGTQHLRELVGEDRYVGLDVVARDERTIVADLNRAGIPDEALARADCVVMLGVLEYLVRPLETLRQALAGGRRVVVSYTPADLGPDHATREAEGWHSHLTLAALQDFLEETGCRVIGCERMESQVLYAIETGPVPEREGEGADDRPAALAIPSREVIVLSGFFGRGNAGDEALVQVLYEALSPLAEIVICVDRHGAYDGFWNWYPYHECRIIHQGELEWLMTPEVRALHILGGGLPIGFNAALARLTGKPVAMTGIDDPFHRLVERGLDTAAAQEVAERLSLLCARTVASRDRLAAMGIEARLGADWAAGLRRDESGTGSPETVYLVLRELPDSLVTPKLLGEYRSLVSRLRRAGVSPRLLPMCPEDERFLERVDASWSLPVDRHWWNPRRLLELIGDSAGVISVGRLHPVIFAACSGTGALAIDIDCRVDPTFKPSLKIRDHAEEFGTPYYASMSEFLDSMGSADEVPLGGIASEEYAARLDDMRAALISTFGLG